MSHRKNNFNKSSQDKARTEKPNKKFIITKKGLLKISIILITLSSFGLVGKIIIDNKVSDMENSINHLRSVLGNTQTNMESSIGENREVNHIVMHIDLLNKLNDKPENIKFWRDKEMEARKLSIHAAYCSERFSAAIQLHHKCRCFRLFEIGRAHV